MVFPIRIYRRTEIQIRGNKMLKKFQKTLSIGLSGLLVLGFGAAHAADTAGKRVPNVLHEMVPHVVLPETIQYNKTAKNVPGTGYTGASPYVATYVAYPSYQVPYATVFRPVGQSVYPVSPPLLPAPLPKEQPELDSAVEEALTQQATEGKDVILNNRMTEPIQLAAGAEELIPVLPSANSTVIQTGIFCQHPAPPPSAWAFSSPLFKIASVPASWGGQSTGSITHNSPRGSGQHLGFQQAMGGDPAAGHALPQGIPYSTFQMGSGGDVGSGVQAQVLPNGMVLLTMPHNHANCGLLRCRAGGAQRTFLLPPGPAGGSLPQPPQAMMPHPMMHNAMMHPAMMSGGMPFMQVAQQQPMMHQMMPPMPMQIVPVTAMTPMGPAIVGYQQVPQMPMPMMNPMLNPAMNSMAMMNPMANPQMQQIQQMQMSAALPNPAIAAQAAGSATETGEDALQPPALIGSAGAPPNMAVVATPFGYAIQVPADALQTDVAAQLAQMQQSLMQSQMPMQMPTNPYAGLYATPFGYIAMNQSAGQFGSLGQSAMMNVGYQPMGMGAGGMSMSDVLQLMTFINSSKPQRRTRLFERIAERRETRRASGSDHDLMTQFMQAWTTPYTTPDTTLRMPARNAYPYGYFGVQALPTDTANYGGYHNLYFGSTTYPGLY